MRAATSITASRWRFGRILVDPEFYFRKEAEPANVKAGKTYRISDLELASRLSFFLWSSIPGRRADQCWPARTSCTNPRCWNARSGACWPIPDPKQLVDNFAGQWLSLRGLQTQVPVIVRVSRFRRQSARRPCARKRNCSSAASCAKIAALLICSTPITRSSTSGWRNITEFPNVYGSNFRRVNCRAGIRHAPRPAGQGLS